MESKHTKGKWIVGEIYPNNIFIDKLPGSNIIVECHSTTLNNKDEDSYFITNEEAESNASHIVKCVNNYDELVKALDQVNDFLTILPQLRLINKDIFDEMINIDRVIELNRMANLVLEATK